MPDLQPKDLLAVLEEGSRLDKDLKAFLTKQDMDTYHQQFSAGVDNATSFTTATTFADTDITRGYLRGVV